MEIQSMWLAYKPKWKLTRERPRFKSSNLYITYTHTRNDRSYSLVVRLNRSKHVRKICISLLWGRDMYRIETGHRFFSYWEVGQWPHRPILISYTHDPKALTRVVWVLYGRPPSIVQISFPTQRWDTHQRCSEHLSDWMDELGGNLSRNLCHFSSNCMNTMWPRQKVIKLM